MSEFNVTAFLFNPSWEQIDGCRKQDLIDIAAHLDVTLRKTLKLSELKEAVIQVLVEQRYAMHTGLSLVSEGRPLEVKPTFTIPVGGSGV